MCENLLLSTPEAFRRAVWRFAVEFGKEQPGNVVRIALARKLHPGHRGPLVTACIRAVAQHPHAYLPGKDLESTSDLPARIRFILKYKKHPAALPAALETWKAVEARRNVSKETRTAATYVFQMLLDARAVKFILDHFESDAPHWNARRSLSIRLARYGKFAPRDNRESFEYWRKACEKVKDKLPEQLE